MKVEGLYILANTMIRNKLLQIKENQFNSSIAESFFNEIETKEKYVPCTGTIKEIMKFIQELYTYTNLTSRILCYDTVDKNTHKKCDIYDESGEKITTINIKRDIFGESTVDDLIDQYKDVDILVIVGDIEKINDVNTSTGRDWFRSNYGMD